MMRERNLLASQMEAVRKLEADVSDALELIELAEADGDAAMTAEATASRLGVADPALCVFKVIHGSIGRLALARALAGRASVPFALTPEH